jgi:hypothetical protein
VLLEAAAVAGEPFEPDLAATIAELPASEGLTALDALLELDLVRPTSVPRRFVFRHPLVRRAVYESARGGWRLAAHARAATELASRGAAAAERAHHVERQVDVRVALASALRAVGELERCRATLLEAIELLPADAGERLVELTALCAAV